MTNSINLSEAVRRAIEEHLRAIEASLRASCVSRSERQSIVENVENQINEMLEARVTGAPTEEDVRALLAELDPPESFGEALESPRAEPIVAAEAASHTNTPHISKCAVVGAAWAVFFLVWGPLLLLVYKATAYSVMLSWWTFLSYPFLVSAPFGATLLGFVSLQQIRHSQGALYGRRLALADALLFPLIVALPVCGIFGATVMVFLDRPGEFFDVSYNHHWEGVLSSPLVWSLGITLWVVIAGGIIWLALRRTRKPVHSQ